MNRSSSSSFYLSRSFFLSLFDLSTSLISISFFFFLLLQRREIEEEEEEEEEKGSERRRLRPISVFGSSHLGDGGGGGRGRRRRRKGKKESGRREKREEVLILKHVAEWCKKIWVIVAMQLFCEKKRNFTFSWKLSSLFHGWLLQGGQSDNQGKGMNCREL